METELAAVSEYLKKIEDEALPSPSRCEGCLREANRMAGENSGLWGEQNVCVSHISVSSKSLWHLCALFVNTGFSMKRNQKLETHPSFLEVDVVGNFLKVQATYSPLVLPSKGLIGDLEVEFWELSPSYAHAHRYAYKPGRVRIHTYCGMHLVHERSQAKLADPCE